MCVEDWFNIMMINDVTEEFQNGGASFEVGSQAARWIEEKDWSSGWRNQSNVCSMERKQIIYGGNLASVSTSTILSVCAGKKLCSSSLDNFVSSLIHLK